MIFETDQEFENILNSIVNERRYNSFKAVEESEDYGEIADAAGTDEEIAENTLEYFEEFGLISSSDIEEANYTWLGDMVNEVTDTWEDWIDVYKDSIDDVADEVYRKTRMNGLFSSEEPQSKVRESMSPWNYERDTVEIVTDAVGVLANENPRDIFLNVEEGRATTWDISEENDVKHNTVQQWYPIMEAMGLLNNLGKKEDPNTRTGKYVHSDWGEVVFNGFRLLEDALEERDYIGEETRQAYIHWKEIDEKNRDQYIDIISNTETVDEEKLRQMIGKSEPITRAGENLGTRA